MNHLEIVHILTILILLSAQTQLIVTQTVNSHATLDIKFFWEHVRRYIRPHVINVADWKIRDKSGLNRLSGITNCEDEDYVINDGRNHCFEDTGDKSGTSINLLIGSELSMTVSRTSKWRTIPVTAKCESGGQLEVQNRPRAAWVTHDGQYDITFTWNGNDHWIFQFRCITVLTTSSNFEKTSTTFIVTTASNSSSEVTNITSANLTTSTENGGQATTANSASRSANQRTDNQVKGDNSNIGLITGTISGVVLIIIIVLVIIIVRKRRRKPSNSETDQNEGSEYNYVNSQPNGTIQNGESEYNVLHERVRVATDDTYQSCDYSRAIEPNAVTAPRDIDRVSYHFVELPEENDSVSAGGRDQTVKVQTDQGDIYTEVTPPAQRKPKNNISEERVSYHMVEIPDHQRTTPEPNETRSEDSNIDNRIYENTNPNIPADSSHSPSQTEPRHQTDEVELIQNDLYEGARTDDADESVTYSLVGEE